MRSGVILIYTRATRRAQKRAAERVFELMHTPAECRTFRRKNANEQIAPENWERVSPMYRNADVSGRSITAGPFSFRPVLRSKEQSSDGQSSLETNVKIKQEI